jgi:protein TonB
MRAEAQHLSPTGVLASLAGAALLVLLVHAFLNGNTERAAPVQAVALIAPPTPSTPDIKKPEQDRSEPIQSHDTTDWTPGAPGPYAGSSTDSPGVGPTGPLGVDQAGTGGGDAFGLAGRPGGRELLLTGNGGGGNPYGPFYQFAARIKSHLTEQLNQVDALKHACYTVDIELRVGTSGSIEGVKVRSSTGDRALDAQLQAALLGLAPMADAPPSGMPWPISLRIVSRRQKCAAEGTRAEQIGSR